MFEYRLIFFERFVGFNQIVITVVYVDPFTVVDIQELNIPLLPKMAPRLSLVLSIEEWSSAIFPP